MRELIKLQIFWEGGAGGVLCAVRAMGIGDCKICHVFRAIIVVDCFEILGLKGINFSS